MKEYNWLGPAKGIERSLELAKLLKTKLLKESNQHFEQSMDKYYPWMSCQAIEVEFRKNPQLIEDFSLINFDAEYLKGYAKAIQDSNEPILFVENFAPKTRVHAEAKAEFDDAEEIFHHSIACLESVCPWMKKLFDEIICNIIPLINIKYPNLLASLTSHRTLGTLYLNVPIKSDENRLIKSLVAIAHELGHHVLAIYQYGDRVFIEGENEFVYSPVRRTERPAIMAFHAAVALYFMTSILIHIKDAAPEWLDDTGAEYIDNTLLDYKKEMNKSLEQLKDCKLTSFGKKILMDIDILMEG